MSTSSADTLARPPGPAALEGYIAPMIRTGQAGTDPGDYFADLGGPVLNNCTVVPIFWGGVWTNPTGAGPTVLQVFAGLASIVSGPYVAGLSQYRGIGPAKSFSHERHARPPSRPPTRRP